MAHPLTPQARPARRVRSKAFLLLLAAMLLTLVAAPLASAGKEGVYISGATYFTLEQVSFSSGADSGSLKFTLRLHNGGTQDVDFNYFGGRVTDSQGRNFSATQINKSNARVLPGQEQDFQFTARTASGLKASDLNVTLFAWDYSLPMYMRDLGSLSVAAAIQESANSGSPETTVSLSQVDAAQASDASVTYQLDSNYFVVQSDGWNAYTSLSISNPGSATVSLPAGLKYRLTNAEGQQFSASVVQGGDQPLLSGTSRKLILQTAVADGAQADLAWSLEMYKGESASESLLGAISLGSSGKSIAIGEEQALTGSDGKKQLSAKVESATVAKQEDQALVQTTVRITNTGTRSVTLPTYAGQVQMSSVDWAADAAASGNTSAFLAPNATAVLNFHALLPEDTTANELQFVLYEASGKSSAGASNAAGGSGASGSTTTQGSATNASSAANTDKQIPVMVTNLDKATEQQGIAASAYTIGDAMQLQASQLVNTHLDTSLMDFQLYENENNDYKTAVAKFKLTNKGTSTVTVPEWSTELIGEDGLVYSGSLIKPASAEVAPNTSYLVSYTYLVPNATQEDTFTLHLYDGKTAAPAKITLGAYKLQFPSETEAGTYHVYPYELNIHDFTVFYAMLNKTFTFEFKVDMDVKKQEQLLIDSATSKLEFDLVDTQDNVLATQTLPFDGIKNGSQTIKFTNDQVNQFSDMYRIRVYEQVATGGSTVKRLLADIKAEN